jgi:hypothetical protein
VCYIACNCSEHARGLPDPYRTKERRWRSCESHTIKRLMRLQVLRRLDSASTAPNPWAAAVLAPNVFDRAWDRNSRPN